MKKLVATSILVIVIVAVVCFFGNNNKVKTSPVEITYEDTTPEQVDITYKPTLIDVPEPMPDPLPFYYEIIKDMTGNDREILARLARLEAENQSLEGQMAAIEVVLNRIMSDEFPNTLTDVVYQKNQFSPAKFINSTTPLQMQYEAVDAVFKETEPILNTGVLFFDTKPYNDLVYTKIDDHYFCYSEKSFNERIQT